MNGEEAKGLQSKDEGGIGRERAKVLRNSQVAKEPRKSYSVWLKFL